MATSPSAARRRIAYPSMSTVDGPCRSVKPANQRGSRSGSTSTHRPVMAPPRSASSARRRHDVPAGPRFARSWHDRAMSLPGTVLERLMATYGSARDDERAAAMRAYMRDQFPLFGITNKSWWDTVDALAAHLVGPIVANHPATVSTMDEWAGEENVWLARTAILHQLTYKEATDTERLFRYCVTRADHRDFFIRKAIGWALRQHAWTDPGAVRRFVAAHTDRLSPLSVREALKNVA